MRTEQEVIEELVEQFLENPMVLDYVLNKLRSYDLDFDMEGALTHQQEELVCQYINVINVQLVAGMIRTLTGAQH